ncbi:hypothetical protein AB0E82_39500 [Streptomyces anulatus]|uniref:hypothetical protein n=1 Tax=Streptomyces anulatus TaxID=1892 RepID=UPI0033D9E957
MGILLIVPSDDHEKRALDIFERLLEKAENGVHNLLLSVEGIGGTVVAEFHFAQNELGFMASEEQGMSFCDLLAIAVSGAHPCGFVMRSSTGDGESVCGWAFREGDPIPLNRAEIFNAYCHNPFSGEITSPEPGISYSDAPVIHI